MLKKRLVGVITVRRGWAVQSFGYRRYLPLGHAECLAENLDRWGVDEILVLCIDRSARGAGPELDLLRRLGALGLSTPLAYGGGVRSVADAGAVIQCGAERVCLDATLRRNPTVVREISALLGAQAVIGVLPLSIEQGEPKWLDHLARESTPLTGEHRALFEDRVVSEALVVDWRNEGRLRGFNPELIRRFPMAGVPLIAFGGVSEAGLLGELLDEERVVAVGIGNFLAYREHAVQRLKGLLTGRALRPASFMRDY